MLHRTEKCEKNSPFLHQDPFALSLHKEFIHPVLLCFKMLFVERLKQENKGNGKMIQMPRWTVITSESGMILYLKLQLHNHKNQCFNIVFFLEICMWHKACTISILNDHDTDSSSYTWFLKPLSTPRVCVQKQCLTPSLHMR